MIRNKIVLLCLLICLHLLAGAQTPAPVKWLLQAPYMRGASFSLVVKDVQEGRTVYSYDTDRLQSPASVLKTVATATALEILGEDYRYPTTLEYDGILENGTLEGNLYIKGSGDPSLGSSHFAPGQNKFLSTWIAALQKAGIKHITGSVISDESIFDTEGVSIKWLREDMGNYYAPGSYGISIFDNMYKLSLQTGAAGTRPVLKGTEPDIPFIRFKNYLKAAPVSSDSAYIIGALPVWCPACEPGGVCLERRYPRSCLIFGTLSDGPASAEGNTGGRVPFLLPYRGGGKPVEEGREERDCHDLFAHAAGDSKHMQPCQP